MNEAVTPEETEEEMLKLVNENYYKVRDCEMYKMEYKECKSLKGRFQQYYLFGETFDCSKWEEDLINCNKALNSKDLEVKALASIIHNENERLEKRMNAHLANDVWKRRSEPPPNWNAQVPEWLEKRQQDSFPERTPIEEQLCIIS